MKFVKAISSLLFMAIMSMILSSFTGANTAVLFGALIVFSLFVKLPKGFAFMALQKEIWENDIVGNLFKDNAFAKRAFNADSFVMQGKVVHIPVAGAPTQVS